MIWMKFSYLDIYNVNDTLFFYIEMIYNICGNFCTLVKMPLLAKFAKLIPALIGYMYILYIYIVSSVYTCTCTVHYVHVLLCIFTYCIHVHVHGIPKTDSISLAS